MIVKALPAARTLVQSIVLCQWLTSTPSRYAPVAAVVVDADVVTTRVDASDGAATTGSRVTVASKAMPSLAGSRTERRRPLAGTGATDARTDTVTGLR